jgi:hypothetical protein
VTGRSLLVLLVAAATAAFVVGTAIERNTGDPHAEAARQAAPHSEAVEGHEQRSHETTEPAGESELRPLGVDVEAAPFVALAAAASLALALAAWLRPSTAPLLLLVAAAFLAFAALDVRELAHQIDESSGGLAALAAAVALAHAAAAAVAVAMARPLSG